jgi:hypothetical protein
MSFNRPQRLVDQTLLNEVEQYLEGTGRDKGGQIKRNLKKLREASAVQMPAFAG